jgi:hypothetical protein
MYEKFNGLFNEGDRVEMASEVDFFFQAKIRWVPPVGWRDEVRKTDMKAILLKNWFGGIDQVFGRELWFGHFRFRKL